MAISRQQFAQLLQNGELRKIFIQALGWDSDKYAFTEKQDEEDFTCECVAEKSGFKIVLVKPAAGNDTPVYSTRKKISNAITKRFRENLIIFSNASGNKQIWHYTVRRPGKPSLTSEIPYHTGQSPELLFQKLQGIIFDLDEQDNITIIDVSQRVSDSFERNAKQVVKKFYREFQLQHRSFLKFIKGIKEEVNQEWYASLMLNRLMFCYFIQKKGFLNSDINYLQNKLAQCGEKFGKDKFYSFYRTFLLTLFHKGLGSPADERKPKEAELIGSVPYLNGCLFDEHIIETEYKDEIQIKDDAFKAVFNFFDEWNWYLDTREHATGNNINPDVIGYIFEQYINDRAQMGAYYTREDITDYISKNCLFPWLIEETARNYAKPFENGGEFFDMIKKSGDAYIYPAVKHGISWDTDTNQPLSKAADVPKEIANGIDTTKPNLLERRKHWNETAPAEAALPTEIWREVMERRHRYDELLQTIKKGGIAHINDCITYNLNISQIVIDWLTNTNDPKAIKYFYEALTKLSVLDPTCGSGAFLFAALNLLEQLYETCLMRMHSFVEEEDRLNAADKKTFKNAYDFFRKTLADVKQDSHPNQDYFIYKSIILRNLYGVDIMNEAVEIAKLRLFLKLVATVTLDNKKPNLGLEPLPDIDFNIRCGNTLIGFATMEQMTQGLRYDIEGAAHLPHIEEQCSLIAKAFEHFKKIQLSYGDDHKSFVAAKRELQKKLDALNDSLNTFLAKTYGILDKEKVITIEVKEGKETKKKRLNQYEYWLTTHQPFHWLAEYYEIIVQRGGFDVIIGNPPYVVYTEKGFNYKLKDFNTLSTGNLYAFCIERSYEIKNGQGKLGMIIPNSSISADKLYPLQKLFTNKSLTWISSYAWRPAKLFEGANMLLAIVITTKANTSKIFSTKYYRWQGDFRDFLFPILQYHNEGKMVTKGTIAKIPSPIYTAILEKESRASQQVTINSFFRDNPTDYRAFYFRAVLYWVKILDEEPIFKENGKHTTTGEMKPVYFNDDTMQKIMIAVMSSSSYYMHYTAWSSCQVINSRDFLFPFNYNTISSELKKELKSLGKKLTKDLQEKSELMTRNYSSRGRTFTMEKQYFFIKNSKPIIDEIDKVLAQHYGFTEEELDFIINYDIKYRMGLGKANDAEEDEEE